MAVAKEAVMDTIRAQHEDRAQQGGFTLIELIVVVAIIAVLAAIAIQAVAQYRASAYDARAMHDLGNAVHAEEAYFATHSTYVSFAAVGPGQVSVPGVAVSGTVHIEMIGDDENFEGSAVSERGSGKTFAYDSVTDTFVND
jgi:prepilin-type N-terminal cleavage/methylation domain-containing protein